MELLTDDCDIDDTTLDMMLGGIFALCVAVNMLSIETAYKEALRGNNIYKMEIKYEIKNSVYVPSDTIFVLIKK